MNTQILVSVVIPTYNREAFLPRAINSVMKQTYCNWELLVVDDGSKDGSKRLIEDYCKKDKKIKYILNQHKKGPSGARNHGINVAKGDYIAFLDSDDEWVNDHIEKIMNEFDKNNNVDWIFTGIKKIIGDKVLHESNYDIGFRKFDRKKNGKYDGFRFLRGV